MSECVCVCVVWCGVLSVCVCVVCACVCACVQVVCMTMCMHVCLRKGLYSKPIRTNLSQNQTEETVFTFPSQSLLTPPQKRSKQKTKKGGGALEVRENK